MTKLDGIIVLTNYDRELYERELNLFPIAIYNPLSLTPEGEGSPAYKRFLSVGRMSHLTKGFDILIEAFAIFARDNKEWTLEIVGEGPEKPALLKQIARHKAGKQGNNFSLHPTNTKTLRLGKRIYTEFTVGRIRARPGRSHEPQPPCHSLRPSLCKRTPQGERQPLHVFKRKHRRTGGSHD